MYTYGTAPNRWQYLQQQKTRQEFEQKRQRIQREFARLREQNMLRYEPDSKVSLL